MTATASARQTGNLPVDVTSFVGRRREVLDARRLLYRSRLLTLTGAGGVGKSRLALRVASGVRRSFVDEVWWVGLATLEHGDLLAQTVTDAIGLRQHAARDPVDTLVGYLADRRVLLVLDNCEHLLQDCAELIDELLSAAAGLRILATSRQGIGVPGEQIFVVPSLSVPSSQQWVSESDLTRYEAINLFVDRTARIQPGFRINNDNRDAVVGLCRRLDGIPLAIELAVVRLHTLPIHTIIDRLGGYFDVLTDDKREALPRHKTLHATLDWSFDLCSPEEQKLWSKLSVFSGGVELEAAEEICSGERLAREDILDAVTGLVDKSILDRTERGDHTRYHMLETIRQYGRQKLADSGHEASVRRRHRDWYVRFAARSEQAWTNRDELDWLNRLQAEHANTRTALDFCFTQPGEAGTGLAMAGALANFWYVTGRLAEAHHWLARGLELAPQPTPARAKALWADARCCLLRGDMAAARPVIDECHVLAMRLHDPETTAFAKQITALAEMLEGDLSRSAELLRQALAGFRTSNDPYGMWYTLYLEVSERCLRGDFDSAAASAEECLALSESRGADWSRSQGLWGAALARWWKGEHDRATALALESLRLKWPLADQWGTALCLEVLAWSAEEAGHPMRAARLLGSASSIWRIIGTSPVRLSPLSTAHQRCETEAQRKLGSRAYAAAVRRGARFSRDQAISYALGEDVGAVGATHAH